MSEIEQNRPDAQGVELSNEELDGVSGGTNPGSATKGVTFNFNFESSSAKSDANVINTGFTRPKSRP